VRCCSLVIFGKRQIYGRTIVRRVITPPRLLPREKSPVLHSSTHRRSAHLHAVHHLRAQRQLPSRKKESLVPTSLRRTKSPRRRLSLPPSLAVHTKSLSTKETTHLFKCSDRHLSTWTLGHRPHPPHCPRLQNRTHNLHSTLAPCRLSKLVPRPIENLPEAHTPPASEQIPTIQSSLCSSLMLRHTNTCITTTG
jgi:hypothetical protein